MDVVVYGDKPLKENTLQSLPEWSRLEGGAIWDGVCFSGILSVHSSLWKTRWINTSKHLILRTMSTPICALFSLSMMTSTSRAVINVIQKASNVLCSKSSSMSLQFFPVQ
ncbi:hypothetical protein TNIN_471311 [Trichonephila inaurata madagascariensis]|uniref:Uncharacterized protein n=1 Tax=Trichonephila inaurata madagascariensis TaxID=2747483 RepID=A0A8X6Y2U3_9ARAC|nr:hypothetical protein TNIN_471311 [Trichonephila inaurata madagascariensis]